MKVTSSKELREKILLQSFFNNKREKIEIAIEDLVDLDEKKALELEIVTLKEKIK